MSISADDLGIIGDLATAAGFLDASGDPDPGWFGAPHEALANILANETQRTALIDFIDEALGGAERETDADGLVWLPAISVDDPEIDVFVTFDDRDVDAVAIGIGAVFRSSDPSTETTISVPLFLAAKEGRSTASPLHLGRAGARLKLSTSIVVDDSAPTPGEAHLGSIAIAIDLPTAAGDADPTFGVTFGELQLPGATVPTDVSVAAENVDELDEAIVELVLSLVREQAAAVGAGALVDVAGLLGLAGDAVPDFPIERLVTDGVGALAAWVSDVMATEISRHAWLDHLSALLGGTRSGDEATVTIGSATVNVGVVVDTGPSGHPRLTPTMRVQLGDATARLEAAAEFFRIDLVDGSATALPSLGVWGASGTPTSPVLDSVSPLVRADTLRIGFSLDADRRLVFVLAADGVLIGTSTYPTIDLTSADAVMDGAGAAIDDIANELLGHLGDALVSARVLLGLDAPPGHLTVPTVSLTDLVTDPVAAVSGHWQAMVADHTEAVTAVLEILRDTISDSSSSAVAVTGSGSLDDPWVVPLIGSVQLRLHLVDDVLVIAVAATTSVDTLGHRCTVVDTAFAATIVEIDLSAGDASLLPELSASLTARERGARPTRALLVLGEDATIRADHVGMRVGWRAEGGLSWSVSAPNLELIVDDEVIAVPIPQIGVDGSVTLPAEGWDAIESLIGFLAELVPGTVGDVVEVLGWRPSGELDQPILPLADLVADAGAAIAAWARRIVLSDLAPRAVAFVADLLSGTGEMSGTITGTGHPDDPYRVDLGTGLPEPAVWFPPQGIEPTLVAVSDALRTWRPGDRALASSALEQELLAEAAVDSALAALVTDRPIADGLGALVIRWAGGDGRVAEPLVAPPGVRVHTEPVAAGQLVERLDLSSELDREPDVVVWVDLGTDVWSDAPAGRRVDLTADGLAPEMLTMPTVASGEWFVALGERAACRLSAGDVDGTKGQAERLERLLVALADVSSDIAVVAIAGAGHAARVAAQAVTQVADLVLLGTPLGPVSLSAITAQPTADAVRLLDRLVPDVSMPGTEDDDLATGRHLVSALMDLVDRTDPASELRPAADVPPPPRTGLNVIAVFGSVSTERVERAITAIVAAGLAERARARSNDGIALPEAAVAGVVLTVPESSVGSLRITGDARLGLVGVRADGQPVLPELRVRMTISDRLGWLVATPEHELRMISVDAVVPLSGSGVGAGTITFHDARVLGASWERLVVGAETDQLPLLPEARILLDIAVGRLVAGAPDAPLVGATVDLASACGLIDAAGAVHDAFDQFVRDPRGLLSNAMSTATGAIDDAIKDLLGPVGGHVDLVGGEITISAGDGTTGLFGWHSDVTIDLGALASGSGAIDGAVTFGPSTSSGPAGAVQVVVGFGPFTADLHWHRPDATVTEVALWPDPDGSELAVAAAAAAPALGAHVALEIMRRADEAARPIVDAALDALGVLGGSAGDLDRPLRPLFGLIDDPARWLRSAGSIAGQPAKAQGLFDALRPLLGLSGGPGDPLTFADGVSLAVAADGGAIAINASVDTSAFTSPAASARLAGGLTATLRIAATGAPTVAAGLHVGLADADPGRQAVHASLDAGGAATLFLRPTSGADVALVPFAGFGSLAALATAALPFVLDELADLAAPIGPAVATVGDALALRTGTPAAFDGAALQAWAADPVAALAAAVPSLVATGLGSLAAAVDPFVPSTVSVTATPTELSVVVSSVTVVWNPTAASLTVAGAAIAVPGVDLVSFRVAVSAAGLDELTAVIGPAVIDVGGVELRPFIAVAAGSAPPGGSGVAIGLALGDGRRFGARWQFDPPTLELVVGGGLLVGIDVAVDAAEAALRAVEAVLDLVASVALATDAVQDLLDTAVGGGQLRDVFVGVVLDTDTTSLIDGVFDPTTLLSRALTLIDNVAGLGLSVTFRQLVLSLQRPSPGDPIGVQIGLSDRFELVSGDVMLWLENDDSWIEGNPSGDGGVFVGLVDTADGLSFEPSLAIYGLGLRVGKLSGPLLDIGLTLESLALHVFAEIDAGGVQGGGAQIQFSELAVAASGASGGNSIASGIMSDTGSQPPQPAFSPALAIQKHGSDDVQVTLRAGEGDGPWWLGIQRGFGPLYLEQVGFGVSMPNRRVERVSILFDGSVSMFGLTCAVDDLEITYLVSRNDFFNPASWDVDLAGLAVSADMAGVTIAGGLLKSVGANGDIEYLGMLLARFGVYGITIYGGYGEGESNGERFVSFFAVGAIVGPIGGPPAFFLTGIGGGFGINRELIVPSDLSDFGDYPLIQALDTAAEPGNPMEQLRALGEYFPMASDTFWFAAGISFTSFVIVDGIAVVAVEIGDGLDINLLGLARLALPRPEVALVSIELALLVRFSTSEGVLWVQGQLTDNSWLLYPDVKLTGGFAFVVWFKGDKAGEFVLTMGGYHPDFHREGYPEVPRLGLEWKVSNNISISAGGYFALTSEALMAGGDFEASARFGPAWAEVRFGAHGIVYFDPFHYKVGVYARISAGVTVDLWIFGEVTISISIGASITVEGPDFHGVATFEVGPVELEVEFGSSARHVDPPLSPSAFIDKYLDRAPDGRAHSITVVTNYGTQPSGNGDPTPDGQPDRPFLVVPEFGLILTTVVPTTDLTLSSPGGVGTSSFPPTRQVGVAPMDEGAMEPEITLRWVRQGAAQNIPFIAIGRPYGSFPVGVWGPPQDDDNRAIPQGDVIGALTEVELTTAATFSPGGPEIPYRQVEIGPRLPLPFSRRPSAASRIRDAGRDLVALATEPATAEAAFAAAESFLAATASPAALASLRRERQAPPSISTLGGGLDAVPANAVSTIGTAPPVSVVDTVVHPPIAVALLPAAGAVALGDPSRAGARQRTSVSDVSRPWRVEPPTLASVEAGRSRSIATELLIVEPPATPLLRTARAGTVVATGDVPPSEAGRARPALVATRGGDAARTLSDFSAALRAGRRVARGTAGAVVGPGDVVVLQLPNARRDVARDVARPRLGFAGPPVRIVAFADGGRVTADVITAEAFEVPRGTERLVVVGQGLPDPKVPLSAAGLAGWHAGLELPYVGWSTAIGPGCTVRTRGELISRHRERVGAGWIRGAELAAGTTTLITRFASPIRTVVLVLDDPEALGANVGQRDLRLGLGGAERASDTAGAPIPPVVLAAENRSVLAYAIEPDGDQPVTVTIVSEPGWSVVGVLGSTDLDPRGAIGTVTARGLDTATTSLATGRAGATRIAWIKAEEKR